ncbi:hypothetical protein QLQ15_01580 [Lysobacter sp. LF1]|uniref:Uncharacterized protein n=1 Tax=Lysobacter stagni TaxID=3045172 RepID=A0ABT6XBT4_9GAMM|nr:hypothetical protein [Lysobacter sp. LF1]MDI9237599.1 hypothetical protein [Lysobacter sp. LF1]
MPRRLAVVVALCLLAGLAGAAEGPGDAHGIRVRAACYQASRLLADLSCERAMDCWRDPSAMGVLDLETGKRIDASTNDLVYIGPDGALLAEPPMQGQIRAVWTFALGPSAPHKVQLVQGDETATSGFEPSADCATLPPAAVRRLAGG